MRRPSGAVVAPAERWPGAVFKKRVPPGLTVTQLLFRALPRSDVFHDGKQKWRHVSRSGNERNIVAYPEQGAVFATVALFYLEILSASVREFPNQLELGFTVLFAGDVREGKRLQFCLCIAQHFLKHRVCGKVVTLEISHGDTDGRVLKCSPPPLFAGEEMIALTLLICRRNLPGRNRQGSLAFYGGVGITPIRVLSRRWLLPG